MSDRTWTLSGFEFRMLMEQFGRDRLPFPIQFQPMADSAADYHRQRHEASESVRAMMTDGLRAACTVILDPLVRIEVIGYAKTTGAHGNRRPEKLRAHAAVRHGAATVLVQEPGDDDRSGGSVVVRAVDSHTAVNMVLDVLPLAGRGTFPRIDIPRDVAGVHGEQSLFHSVSGRTDQEELAKILDRPRSSTGEIHVCVGPAADSRVDPDPVGVQWFDFPGDGRYLILRSSVTSVVPASSAELEKTVRRLVDGADTSPT